MREENFTRRTELDYINAAACLCVILIHVLSYGIGGYGPQSWQAAVIYFPWRLAGFVVPAFLFTGAVKMALFFGDRKITAGVYLRYIWERIRHIYFPYVIWAAVYYLCFYAAGYVQGSFSELAAGIFRGQPVGSVLLCRHRHAVLPSDAAVDAAGAACAVFCVAVCFPVSDDDGAEIFQFSRSVRFFLCLCRPDFSAVSDLLDAGHIRRGSLRQSDGEHTEDRSRDRRGVLSVRPVGTLLAYGNYSRGINRYTYSFLKLVTDIMSILLIWAVCIRIREKNQRAGKLLAKINRASYQVYLSHCLFLTAVTDVLAGYAVSTSVILAVRATIGYTVPFLLYAGWEKVKSGIRRQLPG